ncbi:MAG: protein kinase [Chthoniobacterales bacterium]
MKMFSPGLSDSIASVLDEPRSCPHCASSSHIAGGLCVGCLLEAGLARADEDQSETLTDLLADLNLPDQNWRLGNYEILEEIGRGGMGVIYRARQRHSRRIVAVKRVLSYHADSRETLARFRREAQAAASLDHPNILPIYEVSESEDGLPFFSMKFAPGGSLQEVGPALRNDPRQSVALVARIACAVQYAHSKGILHRDLKPGNILLDGRGEPLVSDFGLAKWLDTNSDLTRTLTIFGTPGYIAPEQASGSAADLKPTADVYSLGAILFDLLAGRPPFLGAHALSVIRQAAESPAPKLRTLSKLADRDLETICSRCLERDPKLRYPSAHDLAEDLERWLEGRPIIARRVSLPVRLWRWSRRNPKLAGSIASCLLLGSIIAITQFQDRLATRAHVVLMHSVAVGPLLDLDTAHPDYSLAKQIADALQNELSHYGPARATPSEIAKVQSATDQSENPLKARSNSARATLQGTKHSHEGKLRLSLRLTNTSSQKVIRRWIIESNAFEHSANQAAKSTASDIYTLLDTASLETIEQSEDDPGWRDESTRELLIAGDAVMERRTLADIDRAIELFEKAVKAQPRSALALSYLAEAQTGRSFMTGDSKYLSAGESSARKAINLNPTVAKPHEALAFVKLYQGHFRESLDETFTAYELADVDDGRLAFKAAINLKMLGRPAQAAAWYRFVLGKDKRPGWNEFMLGDCLADLTDDDRAAVAYQRASSLFPELPEGWMGLCRLALLQKDFTAARNICSENWQRYPEFIFSKEMAAQVEFFSRHFAEAERLYEELSAKDPEGGRNFYGAVSYKSALGRLRLAGHEKEGTLILEQALAKELESLNSAPLHPEVLYRVAAIESSLGKANPALAHLKEAIEAGWIDYRSLILDPRFDGISRDPIFEKIVANLSATVEAMKETVVD